MCFADIYIFVLLFYFILLLFFRFFHLFKLTFIAQPFTRQSRARETLLGYTFETQTDQTQSTYRLCMNLDREGSRISCTAKRSSDKG